MYFYAPGGPVHRAQGLPFAERPYLWPERPQATPTVGTNDAARSRRSQRSWMSLDVTNGQEGTVGSV